jgi:hypothetical protein
MTVFAADIPWIRLSWVSARARRRQPNADVEKSEANRSMVMLRMNAAKKTAAYGVMRAMAKLRLQIRNRAA